MGLQKYIGFCDTMEIILEDACFMADVLCFFMAPSKNLNLKLLGRPLTFKP